MPAPDLLTVFALEPAIEDGFVAIFNAHSMSPVRQRGTEDLPVPRVEIQYQNGPETGHMGTMPNGRKAMNTWQGTISIAVVTNRERTAAAVHDQWCARVRLVMRSFQHEITEARFPYHQIVRVIGQGDQIGINADKCEDVTVLRFGCWVSIRPNAWPV
jgi:hypothetical protein